MADEAFQLRSISLPSRSHPAAARLEEALQKIRTCVASSTSSITTKEIVCDGLRGLGNVYQEIDGLLCLPSNQKSLSHCNQRKWVEEELEVSLRLLDLSGAVRDGLAAAREHLQELQLSHRSKGRLSSESSTLRTTKKTITSFSRSFTKHMESGRKQTPCVSDGALMLISCGLVEARKIVFSLLQSASSFVASPTTSSKESKWSIVSNALHKKKKATCGAQEAESSEEAIAALTNQIASVEDGVEFIYKRLIQNRVSLLNVLSF